MRKQIFAFLIVALASLPVCAQRLDLEFPGLAERASEVVDVTLDANMLRLASKVLSGGDADERAARDVIQNLEGIYVRSYEFDREGEYDRNLADHVRAQLGAGWNRIVTVRSRTRENVEIYAQSRGNAISGLVIIAAEPREFTVVNIVGPIDLDRLSRLEGQFGIPHVTDTKPEKKDNRP